MADEKLDSNNSTTWKQSFVYDRYGNRTFDANNTTTLGNCQTAVCNPTILWSTNRITSFGYSYDAAGSVTLDATGKRYAYDAEGRQNALFYANNQGSTPNVTYEFDGEGKRVRKVGASLTTIFVYDAMGELSAEYEVNTIPIDPDEPRVQYMTNDHLGSPRVVTDANGAVVSRKDFTAFGEEVLTAQRTNTLGYVPPEVQQDYTGYYKDGESGLEYAKARYYKPQHGRFTSVDPLTGSATVRNPQSLNRYSYTLNSPYKFTDPLGLSLQDIGVWQTTNGFEARFWERVDIKAFQKAMHPPPTPSNGTAGHAAHEAVHELSRQQDYEQIVRASYPVLNAADAAIVEQAISDAQDALSFDRHPLLYPQLIGRFSGGSKVKPSDAVAPLVPSTIGSITVTRDSEGAIAGIDVDSNAVYDGRSSTLLVDDDNDSATPLITVSRYLTIHPDVNAVTTAGYIFVGQPFFARRDRDGRAKDIIHESVVHKAYGRRDGEFGPSVMDGSHAINAVIDTFYRR